MKKLLIATALFATLLTGCVNEPQVTKRVGTIESVTEQTYVVSCNGTRQEYQISTDLGFKEGDKIDVWQYKDGWIALSDPSRF